MTVSSQQFREMLAKHDLTQVGFARLIDVNDKTARSWAAAGLQGPTAILVELLRTGRLTVRDIRAVSTPRPGPITIKDAQAAITANAQLQKSMWRKHKRALAGRQGRARS